MHRRSECIIIKTILLLLHEQNEQMEADRWLKTLLIYKFKIEL